ncbi:GCN5-related N-acetyltransferase [Mariniradius saccharolyticus AK6]|uniref:GCN5-related N-acetyltransferase n=1 Tax=Mariniradius saccharolyticus AK6 TaxID=1239962 RepID=M7XBJ3_9BACT|nr:GNAT family protein [Mariniradius saccharolyticus]EMS31963.1 GCN5-related N-acetyltransferase [Mariniradius saccharolyticus AK6]
MLDFNIQLEDDKVVLRPLSREDIGELEELASDPDLWRYYTHDLSQREELEAWCLPAFLSERLQFVVVDKTSGKIIGSSALGNFSPRDGRIEIGWTWLGKSYQGHGFNQSMKKLMLTYCFESLGLERVEFKTDVLNMAARKALRNINAIEEGVLRSHTLMTKGRRRDTIYYSILKNEWEFVKRENEW